MGDIDLHRVQDATILHDGRIALTDAGNFRVLVLEPGGRPVTTFGREGHGPGEFLGLSRVTAHGDSLWIYDPGLRRVTTLLADGSLLDTFRLPGYDDQDTRFRDIASPGRYIVSASELPSMSQSGVVVVSGTLLLFEPDAGSLIPIIRGPLYYRYFLAGDRGFTTYETPFLGEATIAAWPEGIAFAPLDGSIIELRTLSGEPRASVTIPVPHRDLDREAIVATRDSLLDLSRGNPRLAPAIRNIQDAYGGLLSAEGLPDGSPAIRTMMMMGDLLWVERFPLRADRLVRWYAVDPVEGELCAHLDVPQHVTVLGGNEDRVILLSRTSLDVEVVRVRTLERTGGCA